MSLAFKWHATVRHVSRHAFPAPLPYLSNSRHIVCLLRRPSHYGQDAVPIEPDGLLGLVIVLGNHVRGDVMDIALVTEDLLPREGEGRESEAQGTEG